MLLHIITHVVPYLRSIMHMHFYCYLTGGTAYLLDRETEWCYSDILLKKSKLLQHQSLPAESIYFPMTKDPRQTLSGVLDLDFWTWPRYPSTKSPCQNSRPYVCMGSGEQDRQKDRQKDHVKMITPVTWLARGVNMPFDAVISTVVFVRPSGPRYLQSVPPCQNSHPLVYPCGQDSEIHRHTMSIIPVTSAWLRV